MATSRTAFRVTDGGQQDCCHMVLNGYGWCRCVHVVELVAAGGCAVIAVGGGPSCLGLCMGQLVQVLATSRAVGAVKQHAVCRARHVEQTGRKTPVVERMSKKVCKPGRATVQGVYSSKRISVLWRFKHNITASLRAGIAHLPSSEIGVSYVNL